MSFELLDLYQEVLLDHSRTPRGQGTVENPTHTAFGNNPICGDEVTISARVDDGVIRDVRHESSGCAICVASASMMVETTLGKSVEQFESQAGDFYALVRGESEYADGKLAAFSGVSKFPMRVKCATLAWHTLERALNSK